MNNLEHSKEEYLHFVDAAFGIFNDRIGTDYSRENIEVKFITAENADKEIPKFLKKYPEAVEEQMLEPGYYEYINAEAFVTSKKSGILIRTDIRESGPWWRHIMLHEISHIFCTTHELNDGSLFFKKYCLDYAESSIEDGIINAGYAIWREFIAEYMATLVDSEIRMMTLKQNEKHINEIISDIEAGVSNVKECIEAVMIDTLCTRDVLDAPDKKAAFEKLGRYKKIQSVSWQALLNTVYDQLHDKNKSVWEINLDFITTLGSNYLAIRKDVMMQMMDR